MATLLVAVPDRECACPRRQLGCSQRLLERSQRGLVVTASFVHGTDRRQHGRPQAVIARPKDGRASGFTQAQRALVLKPLPTHHEDEAGPRPRLDGRDVCFRRCLHGLQ